MSHHRFASRNITARKHICLFAIVSLFSGQSIYSQGRHEDEAPETNRKAVETAVARGVEYLINEQLADGTYGDLHGKSVGIVGLVGIALISSGCGPESGRHGDHVDRCLEYILGSQKYTGLLYSGDSGHGMMYGHSIATIFLLECRDRVAVKTQARLDPVVKRAIELILHAQALKKAPMNQGGWRYKPDSLDSDLSCSSWALMALRSAKLKGMPGLNGPINDAVRYILKNFDARSGSFGYSGKFGNAETLTGCGLLCRLLNQPEEVIHAGNSGKYIWDQRLKILDHSHGYSANHTNARAMFQIGGDHWDQYATWMYENYLPRQKQDGSWRRKDKQRVYSTAMTILALSVPDCKLKVYQKSETPVIDSGPAEAKEVARQYINSLGMRFISIKVSDDVLWCVHETRVSDYLAFTQESGRGRERWKFNAVIDQEQTAFHPIINVTWKESKAFCNWLSKKEGKTYRLPTDHEWSIAIGIGDLEDPNATPKTKDAALPELYPWGKRIWPPPNGYENFHGQEGQGRFGKIEGYQDHHPGLSPGEAYRSGNGLFNLMGNVQEWCEDWYSEEQRYRVLRGGSWNSGTRQELYSSKRSKLLPTKRGYQVVGFRCVLAND